ncbi:MAG: methyltransferase [Ignavibacteria bacterium]|nr:methyltransferase [Ignavibacteria bacterium]
MIDFVELTKKYPFPEKRPRHHIAPYFYVPFSSLKVVPENYPRPISEINWSEVFVNSKSPNFLDIGCGRGKFLIEMAYIFPDKNILGLEIRKNCVDWLKEVILGERIENAAVVWYNVLNGLNFIENESLEAVFYLFPDPWPKSRHTKRRAMNKDVLFDILSKLIIGGKIYFATDLEVVHYYHIELLQMFNSIRFDEIPHGFDWNLPKTNKEFSCIRRGKPYFRIIAEKIR